MKIPGAYFIAVIVGNYYLKGNVTESTLEFDKRSINSGSVTYKLCDLKQLT